MQITIAGKVQDAVGIEQVKGGKSLVAPRLVADACNHKPFEKRFKHLFIGGIEQALPVCIVESRVGGLGLGIVKRALDI